MGMCHAQIKFRTRKMVYDVGPISNHWRRPFYRHFRRFMMHVTVHPNKQQGQIHVQSVLVSSNADEHIPSQDTLLHYGTLDDEL